MNRRLISIMLVVALALAVLAGCATTTTTAATTTGATTTGAATTAATTTAATTTAATSKIENQGIPTDWKEVISVSKKFPGPEVSLVNWLAEHKGLKGKEEYKIAYVMYSMGNEFPVLMSEAAKKRAGQIGVKVEFFDAKMDVNVEKGIVENAIANNFDAVIFNPVDSVGSASIVKLCNDAGIPAVCVNALLNDLNGLAASCSSDHIQSGELVAQYIIGEVLKGKGNIVIPEGPFAQSAVLDRSQGIYNIVRKYPDVNVIAHDTANWSRAEGLALMENWLNAYPNQIDAIVGENDEMALGCLQAVKTAAIDKTIYAGGIDCIPDALTSLENGELSCTVLQDAIAQSAIALDLAVLVLNGEAKAGETNVWVPYELVLKDQVAEYRMRTDLSVLD